ncbi:hypothetical protein IWW50_007146, partial [Coemansia erecta]
MASKNIFKADVYFNSSLGVAAKSLPLMINSSHNYTIVKMGVDNILKQMGLATTSSPSIHISDAGGEKKELSGGKTLASIGFGENDEKKPKT